MKKTLRRAAAPVVLVLAVMGVAHAADVVAEYYSVLPSAPGLYRSALTATDPLDNAEPVDAQVTNGCPTIAVQPEFTVKGATATIEVWLYATSTGSPLGISRITTATGSGSRSNGASYVPDQPIITADTLGAKYWDVKVRDVSTGSVSLRGWVVGHQTEAAQ